MRRVKIVCTIGPASRDEQALRGLIDAGMDVARLNFSHGTREEHRAVCETIRGLSDRVTIMQDLQGPKIRIGTLEGGEIRLGDGQLVTLTTRSVAGTAQEIHIDYAELSGDVVPGDNIYLADGIIHLEVAEVNGTDVRCRIVHGGVLTSRGGVNMPGVRISTPAMTDKDRADLDYGIELGVDYIALSFVRDAGEVRALRGMIGAKNSTARIIAKVEKREALDGLESIIKAADGLMIARGDLGVEIPTEDVPVVQKSIISECIRRAKPVITATQMLESMVASERPTRAEASDVANAVLDGSDALMLSAETATGRYPQLSAQIMDRIIRKAEEYSSSRPVHGRDDESVRLRAGYGPEGQSLGEAEALADAVSAGAVKVAQEIGAAAIACLTHTGRTARMIASYRPRVPIIALTDSLPAAKQCGLVWGVRAIHVDCVEDTERIFAVVRGKVRESGIAGKVVLTAGIPTMARGPANTVHVVDV